MSLLGRRYNIVDFFFVNVCVFLHVCARCLITAPNIIHMGVEETVSVQLHGATKPASVTLYFRDNIKMMKLSEQKIVNLNEDNQYQAVVTLKASPHIYIYIFKYIDL